NRYLDLARVRVGLAAMIVIFESWSAGVLKISLPHFSITPSLHCQSSRRILRKIRLRCERRVIRRPRARGTFELDGRWFAGPRWPEYPFSMRFATLSCRLLDSKLALIPLTVAVLYISIV